MAFIKLDKLLNKSIKKAGIADKVEAALILDKFSSIAKEILNKNAYKKIKPLYIKNKILTVACLNSVVAQELKFREEEILEQLNQDKSKIVVERIRYLV